MIASPAYLLTKRLLDLLGAALGLALASPFLCLAGLGIRITMGGPVLFRQRRAGLKGRPFFLYKLRTMTDERDERGDLHPDARRLTPLGRLLRQTSLDEFPGLWNVLRGEMSLVGPRPLLLEYSERYDERQRRRLNVLPGVTGWAQVHGRNAISWGEKFELDVWYVENPSTWVDLQALFLTVLRVLSQSGVAAPGEATMEEFQGTVVVPPPGIGS